MKLIQQLSAAALVVAGAAGLLFYAGQQRSNASSPADDASDPNAGVLPSPRTPAHVPPPPTGAAIKHDARALIPKEAWLVADFSGDLTGTLPFSDQTGPCKEVPAPPRVAIGILPPLAAATSNKGESGGPELLLAAPAVNEVFWGCARDRIVAAGGSILAQNAQFEVLKSPSGVVALGPNRAMIYLSNEAYLERGLAVISDLAESASSAGVHAGLYRRIHEKPEPVSTSALDVTVYLPSDWLSSVGDDAKLSPLRHLRAGYISVAQNGSARGGFDCAEPGCDEIYSFLNGAKSDLIGQLPAVRRAQIEAALTIEYVQKSGNISVLWAPTDLRIQDLLGGFFGGSRLFSP